MSILNDLKKIDDWGVQKYWDVDDEGGCPCFSGAKREDGYTVNVMGRCWRVSDKEQDLYVWGDHPDLKKIAKETKRALDAQKWYNPYTIFYLDPEVTDDDVAQDGSANTSPKSELAQSNSKSEDTPGLASDKPSVRTGDKLNNGGTQHE